MFGFFKMSNSIFEYKLSPKAFIVFTFLSCKVNILQSVAIKHDDIAIHCNICRQSVITAIHELEVRKLVTKQNRYNFIGFKSNRYYVKNLVMSKGWFKVERQVFDTDISPLNFMVFAFIKKSMNNRIDEAFPSYNTISECTGISRNSAISAVRYLRSFTFVNRIRRRKRNMVFKQNRYMHFKCNLKNEQKKKARSSQHALIIRNTFVSPNNTLIIFPFNQKCNRLLM